MIPQIDTAIGFVSVMLLLSLIITTIVQAIAALLDLRGNNLVVSLAKLFEQLSPEMKNKIGNWRGVSLWQRKFMVGPVKSAAQELAAAVAGHNSLAPTLTRAKALRPEEVLALLKLLNANANPAGLSQDTQNRLRDLMSLRIPGTSANREDLKAITDALMQRFPAQQAMISNALTEIAGTTLKITTDLDLWFNTLMDRAADRFARNCRICTVIIATIMTLWLGIDSISIYHQVAGNPEVRAKLVQQSDALLKEADQITNNNNRGNIVLKDMSTQERWKDQKADLQTASTQTLRTCFAGRQWLNDQASLKSNTGLGQAFDDACNQEVIKAAPQYTSTLGDIRSQLAGTKLHIFGTLDGANQDSFTFKSIFAAIWKNFSKIIRFQLDSQSVGHLITIILLSLGAPFWFNALRQLSNLKPSLSEKIEQESTPAEGSQTQKAVAARAGS